MKRMNIRDCSSPGGKKSGISQKREIWSLLCTVFKLNGHVVGIVTGSNGVKNDAQVGVPTEVHPLLID